MDDLVNAAMLEPTLRCESITPLGWPVEPEVNITVSRSSCLTRQAQPALQHGRRSSHVCAAAISLSASVTFPEVFDVDQFGVESSAESVPTERRAGEHVANAALAMHSFITSGTPYSSG